ncbi:MAG TPA: general secretion pathway protein GspL [Pseudomonadales bacterium]|jgi:general secretion pathway protein L|nr:general secretion pathway protein GspL [Pseudomonadales bacterium]
MVDVMHSFINRFWCWWSFELIGMMPNMLKRILFRGRLYQIIMIDDHFEIRILESETSDRQPIVVDQINSSEETNQQIALEDARKIELLLPTNYVLSRQITLPKVAKENLREVVGFQLGQETPFKVSHVHYDYLVLDEDIEAKTITIELIVVLKEKLDRILESLNRRGIKVDRVTVKHEQPAGMRELNLIPDLATDKVRNQLTSFVYILFVMLLVLVLLNLGFPLWKKSSELKLLEPIARVLKTQVTAAHELKQRVDIAKRQVDFILEKKQETTSSLRALKEVTQILPDHAWLYQYKLKDNEIQMHGYSASASALIQLLESSKVFKDARFRSSVTQNRTNGLERFHLSVGLEEMVSK